MEKSKLKIVHAAISLFSNGKPFTLDDTAQLAGVSRRTLHRYFTGKDDLIEVCKQTVMTACNAAMVKAYESSDDDIKRLENMLYAVIESGIYSVFIKRMYERSSFLQAGGSSNFENDDVKSKWCRLVVKLQDAGMISDKLSLPWIYNLFGSIADAAILAVSNGDIAKNDAGRLAWYSFSNGIGLKV